MLLVGGNFGFHKGFLDCIHLHSIGPLQCLQSFLQLGHLHTSFCHSRVLVSWKNVAVVSASPPWRAAVRPEAPLWLRILRDSKSSKQSQDCAPCSNLPGRNSSNVLALGEPSVRTWLWATLPTSDGDLESPGPNSLELAPRSILVVP